MNNRKEVIRYLSHSCGQYTRWSKEVKPVHIFARVFETPSLNLIIFGKHSSLWQILYWLIFIHIH